MLIAYLDGEASQAEAEQVRAALQADPQLRRHAEQLARSWALLDVLDDVPVPAGLDERVIRAAWRAWPVIRLRRLLVRVAVPIAAAMVLAVGAWLWSVSSRPPARFHAELGISPDVEEAIVRNLDLLKAIDEDPALLEEAEFLIELDRQLQALQQAGETTS